MAGLKYGWVTLVGKNKNSLPVKTQDHCYSVDIAESDYDNHIALSSANVKGERIKFEKYVCNKKVIYWFLIRMYSIK